MYGKPEITNNAIKCEVCGAWFKKITNAHLKRHNLTFYKYKLNNGFNKNQPLEALYIKKLRRKYVKLYEQDKAIKDYAIKHPENQFKRGKPSRGIGHEVREQERQRLESIAINIQSTPRFRKIQSKAMKLKWKSPEYREKIISTLKKSYSTPQAKKRMSKISRDYWQTL